ncbi:MAG: hypothetical protein H7A51_12510 [Akkermansiaceae bacterium]|nr:hypothetical protein [Akkermansiaceae bacterium]
MRVIAIHTGIANLVQKWAPDEATVEGIIYVQSHRTAIAIAHLTASDPAKAAVLKRVEV